MPRTARLLLACSVAWVIASTAAGVQAQSLWNWGGGWGLGGNPTTTWSPEAVADYVLTGQTPHPAVARIVAPEGSGTSLGSGVLVDVNHAQGLVLTNWHVVRDARSALLVQFPDGFQSAGTVIRWDEAWDLAAIVIWKPSAAPVPVAAQPPAIGEPLTIAGFGRGSYREETGPCLDYLSPGTGYGKEFVELRATARQGDSGGPIFNARRELAGVLFGQNEGRTLGSCSSRVRAFLATAGSTGFSAASAGGGVPPASVPQAAGAVNASIAAPVAVAAPLPVPATPAAPSPALGPPPPLPGAVPATGATTPAGFTAPAGFAPVAPAFVAPPGDLAALFDIRTNSTALLTSAGGLALLVLGLRTVFGGRRRDEPVHGFE
jgi:hypothetical protein